MPSVAPQALLRHKPLLLLPVVLLWVLMAVLPAVRLLLALLVLLLMPLLLLLLMAVLSELLLLLPLAVAVAAALMLLVAASVRQHCREPWCPLTQQGAWHCCPWQLLVLLEPSGLRQHVTMCGGCAAWGTYSYSCSCS